MCSAFFDSLRRRDGSGGISAPKARLLVDIFVPSMSRILLPCPSLTKMGYGSYGAIVACYAQGNALNARRVGFRGFGVRFS